MRTYLISNMYKYTCYIYIYQAIVPRPHRERQYADYYAGLHFGLLHIHLIDPAPSSAPGLAPGTGSGAGAGEWWVDLSIIDHTGEVAVGRRVNLRPRFDVSEYCMIHGLSETECSGVYNQHLLSYLAPSTESNKGVYSVCKPIHGELPLYRTLLVRFMMALPIFVVIILPLLGLLWLIFACIFYVLYGYKLTGQKKGESRGEGKGKKKDN